MSSTDDNSSLLSLPPSSGAGADNNNNNNNNKNNDNDNGYTPGSSLLTQFSNVYSYMTGRMNEAGIRAMRRDQDIRNEPTDCARCESHRNFLLAYSPIIRFLQSNIQQLGGGEISAANMHCRRCEGDQQGGFDPTYGIVLCANGVKSKSHVEDAMAHEMVHAYDHLRFKLDWSGMNLRHAACSEVRTINFTSLESVT